MRTLLWSLQAALHVDVILPSARSGAVSRVFCADGVFHSIVCVVTVPRRFQRVNSFNEERANLRDGCRGCANNCPMASSNVACKCLLEPAWACVRSPMTSAGPAEWKRRGAAPEIGSTVRTDHEGGSHHALCLAAGGDHLAVFAVVVTTPSAKHSAISP